MEYIEKRINRLLADAAVLEAKLGNIEYKLAAWLSDNPGENAGFEIQGEINLLSESFKWNLESLYLSSLTYLDEKN